MQPSVLVVGHDEDRLQATRDSLALGGLTNPVVACRDAVEASDYVRRRAPFDDAARYPLPAVVVTDLHPGLTSAVDVLRVVRNHTALRRAPVIVVADLPTDNEIAALHDLGAAAVLGRDVAASVLVDVIRDTGVPWSVGRVEAGQ